MSLPPPSAPRPPQVPATRSKLRRNLLIAGGILVALVVIGTVFGDDDENNEATSDTTIEVSDTTAAPDTTAGPDTTARTTTTEAPTTTAAPTSQTETTTTVAATTTPAPTTTTTTTTLPPTTAAPAAPLDYVGSGDQVIQVQMPDPTSSVAIAAIVYTGESNFAVWALDANLEQIDLLVNAIGGYAGTVPIGFRGEEVAALEISAAGEWAVQLKPIETAREMTDTISGTGDDVFVYRGDTAIAHVTHDGESNFALIGHPDAGLLINEIGPYDGTVRFEGEDIYEVTADGNWTVAIE